MNQLEEEFFNRLRSRVIDAGNHGIYVGIMLYDLYAFSIFSAPLDPMWGGNVFNAENNINGITANTNDDGWGGRIFYCAFIRNRLACDLKVEISRGASSLTLNLLIDSASLCY